MLVRRRVLLGAPRVTGNATERNTVMKDLIIDTRELLANQERLGDLAKGYDAVWDVKKGFARMPEFRSERPSAGDVYRVPAHLLTPFMRVVKCSDLGPVTELAEFVDESLGLSRRGLRANFILRDADVDGIFGEIAIITMKGFPA